MHKQWIIALSLRVFKYYLTDSLQPWLCGNSASRIPNHQAKISVIYCAMLDLLCHPQSVTWCTIIDPSLAFLLLQCVEAVQGREGAQSCMHHARSLRSPINWCARLGGIVWSCALSSISQAHIPSPLIAENKKKWVALKSPKIWNVWWVHS